MHIAMNAIASIAEIITRLKSLWLMTFRGFMTVPREHVRKDISERLMIEKAEHNQTFRTDET